METIIALVFSKIGAVLVGAGGLVALWLWGKWHKSQAEKYKEAARRLEVTVETHEVKEEMRRETEKEVAELDKLAGDSNAISDAYNRLRGD